jgi:hypothetical protein
MSQQQTQQADDHIDAERWRMIKRLIPHEIMNACWGYAKGACLVPPSPDSCIDAAIEEWKSRQRAVAVKVDEGEHINV